MKGGGSMEQMKVSSIMKVYPNSFVLAQAIKRNKSGIVELAQVLGVCSSKYEAFTQQTLYEMLGIKTFLIPTFEDSQSALQIELSEEEYKAEPLLSPKEVARIYRQYFDF